MSSTSFIEEYGSRVVEAQQAFDSAIDVIKGCLTPQQLVLVTDIFKMRIDDIRAENSYYKAYSEYLDEYQRMTFEYESRATALETRLAESVQFVVPNTFNQDAKGEDTRVEALESRLCESTSESREQDSEQESCVGEYCIDRYGWPDTPADGYVPIFNAESEESDCSTCGSSDASDTSDSTMSD